MAIHGTLCQVVEERARRESGKVFCYIRKSGTNRAISYGELFEKASLYCGAYQALGVDRGSNIFIQLSLGEDLIYSFVGAMLGGYIPSFVSPPGDRQEPAHYWKQLIHQCQRVEGARLLTSPDLAGLVGTMLGDTGVTILSTDALQEHFRPPTPVAVTSDEIALLQHSSGTTGSRKGVALAHRAILDQVGRYAQLLSLDANDVVVSWLPLYHDMGLISSFLLPMVTGTPLVLLDPFEWVAAPWTLLTAISDHRGTLTWLPNFAFHFLARTPLDESLHFDLSTMKAFINCSEPCKAEAFEVFEQRFEKYGVTREQLQISYAMAEAVFAVTQTPIGRAQQALWVSACCLRDGRLETDPAPDDGVCLMSVGAPVPGVLVKVLDEAGNELPDGHVGEIALSAPYMFEGYYREPALTAAAIRDGFYLTGDLGGLFAGNLYVTGRKKDLIIVNGKNYYAHDVEEVAGQVAGVKPGRCVAFGLPNAAMGSECIHVVVESEAAEAEFMSIGREIKKAVQQQMGLLIAQAKVVPPKWLIKTTSGKISRWGNREKYLGATKAQVS
jgi:acyl-CoA synthetase (AMP-forming)/AMP-acid ligase II